MNKTAFLRITEANTNSTKDGNGLNIFHLSVQLHFTHK